MDMQRASRVKHASRREVSNYHKTFFVSPLKKFSLLSQQGVLPKQKNCGSTLNGSVKPSELTYRWMHSTQTFTPNTSSNGKLAAAALSK
jgi:hypothetical protein